MEKIFNKCNKKAISLKTHERHCRLAEEAIKYMKRRRFRKDFTVAQLVQELDTNETTLKQAFKKFMGTNLSTYLHDRCMAYAAKMLSEGKSVNDTALESGYSAISHFSFAFKRTFGICPSLYAVGTSRLAERKRVSLQPS